MYVLPFVQKMHFFNIKKRDETKTKCNNEDGNGEIKGETLKMNPSSRKDPFIQDKWERKRDVSC